MAKPQTANGEWRLTKGARRALDDGDDVGGGAVADGNSDYTQTRVMVVATTRTMAAAGANAPRR